MFLKAIGRLKCVYQIENDMLPTSFHKMTQCGAGLKGNALISIADLENLRRQLF